MARKVVGVGSVGTRCWVILLSGNGPDDPLFLQYKEAQTSVLAPYSKTPRWECEGKRVVVGQRLIQGAPDIFLGWGITGGGSHFYMRQLRDMKGGVEFDPKNVKYFPEYCKLCGWALALAHAKSGDPAAIAGYLGKSEAWTRPSPASPSPMPSRPTATTTPSRRRPRKNGFKSRRWREGVLTGGGTASQASRIINEVRPDPTGADWTLRLKIALLLPKAIFQ